jgi:hypothetical protein
MWDRMARGQDSINLNDPEHSRTRSMMERFGTPIPANGILTKEAYMAEAQKRMASMGMSSGGGGSGSPVMTTMSGSMSPDGRMTFTPGFGGRDRDNDRDRDRDRDRDNDRDRSREMGNFGGNWGGGDMGGWGNRQDSKGNPEDVRPVAIRFGHLPKDVKLPDWFYEYDSTKDAQIALHEWLKGAKAAGEAASVESFAVYDLNGDQLITVEEVLRYDRLQADSKRVAAIQQGESTRPSFVGPGGGRTRIGAGGPGSLSSGNSLSGSSSDKSVTSPERGKGNRDSDKPERKADRKPERNDSDTNDRGPAGSNGPWGNGGKKKKN